MPKTFRKSQVTPPRAYGLTTPTNTTLALNLGGGTLGVVTDSSNTFKTVNANVTAATTLGGITDTAIKTLAVSGTNVLTLSAVNTALTSVTVTGAAGLNANLSGVAGLTSLAFTNSGTNTITLNSTTQAYSGGSGNDIVTISADATKVITGGAGTNELVLNAGASNFTAANTVANVTGFTTLGTNTGSSGSYDLSVLTGFNAIDVQGIGGATTFTKVAQGTTLAIDAAPATAIIYQTVVGANDGVSDSVSVSLNGLAAGTGTVGYTVNALTLQDINSVGIAHVNIATDASVGGGAYTITTLTDANLNTLNITGTGSLVVTNAITTSATSLSINDSDTSTAATTLAGITDNTLGNLSYAGTHSATITALSDTAANVTISDANTGTTGVLTIGGWTDATLSSLTLRGSVALTGIFASTGGVTIAGTSDNSAVSVTVDTASSTNTGTDAITLGNAGNTVVDHAWAATVNVKVGSGANTITVGDATTNNTVGVYNVTLGAHAGNVDTLNVGTGGTNFGSSANLVVTGAAINDVINFTADTGNVATGNLTVTAGSSVANTLALIEPTTHTIHGVYVSVYGGNTYIAENLAASATAATAVNTTVVELIGSHTVSVNVNGIHVAS